MRRFTLALLTAALLLIPAAAASAHAEIKSLSPKPGAVKSTSLRHVKATFEEAIVSGTLVVRHHGKKASKGKAKYIKAKAGMRAKLKTGLHAGTYKAKMKWLADDGHLERKTWTFKLR